MKQRIRNLFKDNLLLLVMFCIAVIGLSPIIWVVMTSFKPALLTFAIPPTIKFKPSLDGYNMLFFTSHQSMGLNVARNLTNSIITSISTTFLTMIIGCFAAFSLLNFRFRFRKTILFAILASRMLPPIGTIIPFFLLINSIGLMDTKIALIMAYTALNLPLTVWMLRGFMADIPSSLIDAGLIDGCSYFSMLFLIYLPVVMPGIVATSVFTFLQSWNDFSIAIAITQSNYSKTLPLLAMSFITEEGIQWAPMAAAITLTIVPPIVFVLLTHKGLAKGMTFGAVKE